MKIIGKVNWVLTVSGLMMCGFSPVQADPYELAPLAPGTNGVSSLSTTNPYPDAIGLSALRAITTNLDGSGIRVAQPEASEVLGASPSVFELKPSAVGQPTSLFSYYCSTNQGGSGLIYGRGWDSVATVYPNPVGSESGHAENVGADFYGTVFGVATNVAHVDNYDALSFLEDYVIPGAPIAARVINQSYTFGVYNSTYDQWYDDYAAEYGVLFISAAGTNGSPVFSPATCFNGIAVGVYNSSNSPVGPTEGDQRCKPDITAWGNQGGATSYSTPQVAGAATLLLQAGTRGDGGLDTNSATDLRTVKALLLNGAVKPVGWSNTPATPLDPLYGAGVLNVLNSYEQLACGKQTNGTAEMVTAGADHPPLEQSGTAPLSGQTDASGLLRGWDFNTITSSDSQDAVNDYYFAVTNGVAGSNFSATATLVWNRQEFESGINNLGLFLYNTDTGELIDCSTSIVDNVQHVYVPSLPPGYYDLQVWEAGGGSLPPAEAYGLAFEFFTVTAQVAPAGTNMVVSWPVYPAGFEVVAATNFMSTNWMALTNVPPVIVGNQYQLTLPDFNPNAIHFVTVTNVGSGGPGFGNPTGPGITNVETVPVYDNNMDFHYLRLRRPNL